MAHVRAALAALITATSLFTCGCVANYVNVPPQPGDTAFHNPDLIPVPELMTDALTWVTAKYPVDPPYAVNLPPGTGHATYVRVVEDGTRGRGVPMSPEVEGLPTYHVAAVRIRGTRATVDVVLPEGLDAVACTVTLRSTIYGWRIQDSRSWLTPVIPVPAPYYLPPEEPLSHPADREQTDSDNDIPETDMREFETDSSSENLLPDDTTSTTEQSGELVYSDLPNESEPAAEDMTDTVTPAPVAGDLPPDAVHYVIHPDGTIERDGYPADLRKTFAGIDENSSVLVVVEHTDEGEEAPITEAVLAAFRIRGVANLVVQRVPEGPVLTNVEEE